MRAFARALATFGAMPLALASFCAVGGVLFSYLHGGTTTAHAVAYALWIGGGLLGLLVGRSGSPSRMALEGRWGPFGQYWGSNRALPESPLWLIGVSFAVIGLGVAVFTLA